MNGPPIINVYGCNKTQWDNQEDEIMFDREEITGKREEHWSSNGRSVISRSSTKKFSSPIGKVIQGMDIIDDLVKTDSKKIISNCGLIFKK